MSADPALSYRKLERGDPFPWVWQRTAALPEFGVDTMAGRYLVLCFYGSRANAGGQAALEAVGRHRSFFDDDQAAFFGVSIDPADEAQHRVRDSMPGVRFLWDFDLSVSRQCGAAPKESAERGSNIPYRQFWLVVDPTLHVLATFPFGPTAADHEAVFEFLRRLPRYDKYAAFEIPAPVLILPNVFDERLCRNLVSLYDHQGGEETGVTRDGAGVQDQSFKRRRDITIRDHALNSHLRALIWRRVSPEIERLFFMRITHMERYIIGCYTAEDGGHFRPHRDNGGDVTAHRRFAVSVNLTGDFEGGEVSFPEYSRRGIKAPPGWCVVFPCAILHMVSKVTRGKRYAFLPFVYDEEGARMRERAQRAASAPATGERAGPAGVNLGQAL